MVDTIAFRIHDLQQHARLAKYLHKRDIEGIEKRVKRLDDDFNIGREMRFKEYSIDYATGKTFAKSFRSKIKSYNSDISYCIEIERDFIHIEFSIPKYYWGDNVHQFVAHEMDQKNHEFRNHPWYELGGSGFMMLRKALKNFFAREFGEHEVKMNLVELVQLDLCFNYVFRSENQLKAYLAFIRQVKKKYAKDENQHSAYGPSSIYYPSKICTFKIYHKGPELVAHPGDIKRKCYYRGLQDLANRTLRYEASFRPIAFRELWLNRSPIKQFVLAYRRWMKEGKFIFNGRLYKVGTPGKDSILKKGKMLDRRWRFWFDLEDQDPDNGNVSFDQELFKELVKSFWHQSKQFMLVGATKLNCTAESVEYYERGSWVKAEIKGLSVTKIKFIEALLRDGSWSDIERRGIMSPRQLARYKAKFKQMGFGDVHTTRDSLTNLDYTFKTYFDNIKAVKNTTPLPFR